MPTISASSKWDALRWAPTLLEPWLRQKVQRAWGLPYQLLGHASVASGGRDARMAQQGADDTYIGAFFEQMCRKAVTEPITTLLITHVAGFCIATTRSSTKTWRSFVRCVNKASRA